MYNDPTGHQASCMMGSGGAWVCNDNAVMGGTTIDVGTEPSTCISSPACNDPLYVGKLLGGMLVGSMVASFSAAYAPALITPATTTACADGDCTNEATSLTQSAPRFGQLRYVGQGVWESTAGLRYGPDQGNNVFTNRVQHVLAHSVDDLTKKVHGVFSTSRSEVLGIVDEGWNIIQQSGISGVTQGTRTVYTVDMGRTIGYIGGVQGQAMGNPTTHLLKIVVENANSIVTAFPVP